MTSWREGTAILMDAVTFAYPPLLPGQAPQPLLGEACLDVHRGSALAVMGSSGSGKSTLCYLLAGLAPRYTGGEVAGTIYVAGHDVIAAPPLAGAIGLLFQDAATQLFNATVADEVAWGLEAMGVPPVEIGQQVQRALQRFGLTGLDKRPPWALSGGQQKRLALAAVWAMHPQVLLLDEPLGGLDPLGRTEVLAALQGLREEGTALLLTTLRPQSARQAEHVTLLKQRALSAPILAADALAQTSQLAQAGILYPQFMWPALRRAPEGAGKAPPAIHIEDVRFHYPGSEEVLCGVDLTVPQGQFVALVGANGAGKTTLLHHINGLLRPVAGTIQILGEVIGKRPVGELARDVGFLFQRPEQQIFGTTVREEIAYGPRQLGLDNIDTRVGLALEHFELSDFTDMPPAILSYGIQRAVTLAALTALDTPILVLDEPTVGLDGHGWAQFLTWLAERRKAGVTILIATHELALAAQADRVVAMKQGNIVADGSLETVLPSLSWEMIA